MDTLSIPSRSHCCQTSGASARGCECGTDASQRPGSLDDTNRGQGFACGRPATMWRSGHLGARSGPRNAALRRLQTEPGGSVLPRPVGSVVGRGVVLERRADVLIADLEEAAGGRSKREVRSLEEERRAALDL